MTGRGGGYQDRMRWSTTTCPVERPVIGLRESLHDDRTRWWSPGLDAVVKHHCVRFNVRSQFNVFLQSDLRRDFS
jgi:hypothetical protein